MNVVGPREYYDAVATKYDRMYSDDASLWEDARIVDELIPMRRGQPEGFSVLDLGCGTGLGYDLLRRAGWRFGNYVGVDVSHQMVVRTADRMFHVPVACTWSVTQADIGSVVDMRPVINAGPYDAVVSFYGPFSWVEPLSLWVLGQTVKPGGRFFFTVYGGYITQRVERTARNENEQYAVKTYRITAHALRLLLDEAMPGGYKASIRPLRCLPYRRSGEVSRRWRATNAIVERVFPWAANEWMVAGVRLV